MIIARADVAALGVGNFAHPAVAVLLGIACHRLVPDVEAELQHLRGAVSSGAVGVGAARPRLWPYLGRQLGLERRVGGRTTSLARRIIGRGLGQVVFRSLPPRRSETAGQGPGRRFRRRANRAARPGETVRPAGSGRLVNKNEKFSGVISRRDQSLRRRPRFHCWQASQFEANPMPTTRSRVPATPESQTKGAGRVAPSLPHRSIPLKHMMISPPPGDPEPTIISPLQFLTPSGNSSPPCLAA